MYKDPNSFAKPLLRPPTPPLKTATAGSSPPLHDEARRNHHRHHTVFAPVRLLLAASSWLRMRRSRYLFLLLCSPILLPLLCATFPLLCAAEVCVRICRGRRTKAAAAVAAREWREEDDERLRRCEEGCGCGGGEESGDEVGLLQRYLEDQLMLVGSVYDCGEEQEEEEDRGDRDPDGLDYRVPLLS